MERRSWFYLYKMLHSEQERAIFMEMEKNYLEGFYYKAKGAKSLSEEDVHRIYYVYAFAYPERIIIPLNDAGVLIDGDEFEIAPLTSNFKRPSIKEIEFANHRITSYRSELDRISDKRTRINALAKIMGDKCVYYLGNDCTGEMITDLLSHNGGGSGYCTGIARTVAAILPFIYCVRGKIKSPFSLIRDTSYARSGTNHVFNAYFDEFDKRYYFFDMCSVLSTANHTQIENEIKRGYHRKSHSDRNYQGLTFYTMEALKYRYRLEDEWIWK